MSAHDPIQSQLLAGLAELGLDPAAADALRRYLDLLARWNQTYNLTAIRDPAEMVSKHLLDSLSIATEFDQQRLVDIGSGAGLPGIPLALACPHLRVTMVESAGKKARFMREAVRQLDLGARVDVVEGRAEALDRPGQYDRLSARALGTLTQLLDLGGHLLQPGGLLLAMKGKYPDDELAALPSGYRLLDSRPLAVPGLIGERHLLRIEKLG
ncbi:16S rRNA (guanine(527)-N(7))-methyltransferase RsmG [Pseudomarimonas arenosa]|uniref:Ribosomal RNA small subunit methyltransferase G n=1 Tax=Pseudomarimonas arenosa TaxID=2774145 RepID=A0AAW3ZQK7_9GAMM|nr:16S rRNA (guanine(527)-N(7))-methyltransferase RsmG [Pseudomarimonas arenosa]MBD8528008.1 16S rRNA (guanine(527)-N(7))-methyltransferase RsmG [Pseudomarimonas arenosa]